jgi:putative salt-induced outer membrane protein
MEDQSVLRKMQCVVVFMLISSALMLADQITLKNGDHLTGKIVKSDGKTVVLHTEFAGDVTIQFAAIDQITTDQELHVDLKGGKTAVGTVTTTDGKLEIATKTSGTVEAPKEDVTVIRNDAEQTAYDKSMHPTLRRGWTGGANVGFSLARGNSETENLALAFNAVHPTIHDKITLSASSVYTANNAPGAVPTTIANLVEGLLRYDHNINARTFVFVGTDFMSNQLQELDLRAVYDGGLGLHAIKTDKTILDFFAGGNYTHETYSNGPPVTPPTTPPTFTSYGKTDKFGALTLGEELTQKLGASTVVTQKFYFYPDLSDTSQYRGTFDFGTVTKISKWLGWQNQFADIYVTNPPSTSKKNDIIFTTGLNIAFAH